MPDEPSLPLQYTHPETARPMRSAFVRRVEFGSTIATLLALIVLLPGLYRLGLIDIIVLNQTGRFLAYAIAAIGVDLIWGYCGILTLCQAMFFCFGGYAIGMHMALHGPLDGDGIPRCLYVVTSVVQGFKLPEFWRPFQTLPAAIALALFIPGIVAFFFGYFAFRSRIRGVYFSIITQATTVAVALIFRRNETRLCGTNGLTNFETLAGYDLRAASTKLTLYFMTVGALLVTFVITRLIVRSRLGRLLVAVRDNESRLRFAGYQPVTIKVFAFVVGAVFAGLGGMLYTPQNGIITPYKMEPQESIDMVIWVAVGGRGTLAGAVLGAILVNYVGSILTSTFPAAWPFIKGGIYIAVVLVLPDGIIGTWRKMTRGERAITPPADRDEAPAAVFSPPAGPAMTPEGAR
jgi:urea transport system permease protein